MNTEQNTYDFAINKHKLLDYIVKKMNSELTCYLTTG